MIALKIPENYYLLLPKFSEDAANVFPKAGCNVPKNIIESLEGKNRLSFEFDYSKNENKPLIAYQQNTLNLPLFSSKFKEIIEQNLLGTENIDWITAYIYENRFYQKYYVLRFNALFDVLNLEKTKFVFGTNFIEKPIFDASKIQKLAIFTLPAPKNHWKITTEIYVSEAIMKALKNSQLKGLDFVKINVV
jgi:hypothetical protein